MTLEANEPFRLVLDELARPADEQSPDWVDVIDRASAESSDSRSPVRRATRTRRRYLALAAAVLTGLIGAVAAVGGRIDFLGEAERADWRNTPPPGRPSGPFVEIARGSDWSFMAYKANRGENLCVAYAAGAATAWSTGCSPLDAKRRGPGFRYLIALLGRPNERGGAADGLGAIVGAVTPDVARIDILLADGRSVSTRMHDAPDALDTTAKFFIVRTPLELQTKRGPVYEGGKVVTRTVPTSPVVGFIAYAADGRVLERVDKRE